jgi:hypothetical protein
MSISGIGSSGLTQLGTQQVIQPSHRQSEDQIGRQLEQDLQSGDLTGAQQAYSMLAAFGNGSGPFSGAKMQAEFQTLGADLQGGNLAAAQADNTTLTTNLLSNDVSAALQDKQGGDSQSYNSAVANLKGDYWAVYGQQLTDPNLQGMISNPVNIQA